MSAIFDIVSIPFGYVMRFIYEFVGNYGLSIVLFAVLCKILMIPLSIKQKRSMMISMRMQPKIQELQRKYGKDTQRLNQELSALYDREGASPMAGCGTMLLTLPIMFGLYYVISQPLKYFMRLTADQIATLASRLGVEMSNSYTAQIGLAGMIGDNFEKVADISENLIPVSFNFLGMNLAQTPSIKEFGLLWLIPILSGLTAFAFSYMQTKLNQQNGMNNAQAQSTNKMMLIMMPLMSLYFGFVLPAGLGLYWIVNNLLSAVQELILNSYLSKKFAEEDEKRAKQAAARKAARKQQQMLLRQQEEQEEK